MILLLDIGNSRVKWRLMADEVCVEEGAFDPAEGLTAFMHRLKAYSVTQLWVAEVGDVLKRFDLLAQLALLFPQLVTHIVVSEAHCLGVKNSYAEPQRLGVDRWLGAVEAWHMHDQQPVAVFDLGTAAKMDVVADAQHCGGHIVPGLQMMRSALQLHTQKVRFDELDEREQGWGKSTQAAVENGTWVMLLAWLQLEMQRFQQQFPDGQIFLAGGDAASMLPQLSEALREHVFVSESLVLNALQRLALGARE